MSLLLHRALCNVYRYIDVVLYHVHFSRSIDLKCSESKFLKTKGLLLKASDSKHCIILSSAMWISTQIKLVYMYKQ